MVIRKPEVKVNVDALIDQGAKVKEDCRASKKEWVMINLRISKAMLEDVDRAVSSRAGITRTGWILESIHTHLERE